MSILNETLRQRNMYRERYKLTKELYSNAENKEKKDIYFGMLLEIEHGLCLFFNDDEFVKELKGE